MIRTRRAPRGVCLMAPWARPGHTATTTLTTTATTTTTLSSSTPLQRRTRTASTTGTAASVFSLAAEPSTSVEAACLQPYTAQFWCPIQPTSTVPTTIWFLTAEHGDTLTTYFSPELNARLRPRNISFGSIAGLPRGSFDTLRVSVS